MRKIVNPHLARLQMQLKFASPKKRREFLQAAEDLLDLIEPDKEYPFDFVCFKITGYHPKDLPQELINGAQLIDDLSIFLWKLSGKVDDSVNDYDEKIYTIKQLADELNVSTKTIARWRRRGLRARKYIFRDGSRRLAVSQSGFDKFVAENRDLVEKAAVFSRLDKKQTEKIITLAKQLSKGTTVIRSQAIDQIAEQTGRARETVRAVIEQYEKSGRRKKLFRKYHSPLDPAGKSEVYKLYKKGVMVPDIAARFNRTKSDIYRIIKQKRAQELLAVRVEFVPSDEFLAEDAEQKIIGRSISKLRSPKPRLDKKQLTAGSVKEYLDRLKSIPRLTRNREADLFRQYNYLKFRAAQARRDLHISHVSSKQLNFIEKCLRHAEAVKNTIIEANLSLVIGIAGKHTTTGATLQDLISEGNFSLMNAVEKFDYTKGFRLATYASWIIAKDFARKVPSDRRRPGTGGADALDNIQRDLRVTEGVDFGAIERARHSLVQVIQNELDEREQYVILHHYGLTGSSIIKQTETLRQIGGALGLSAERVRQLELSALQKLKQSLSIEEFELLTG